MGPFLRWFNCWDYVPRGNTPPVTKGGSIRDRVGGPTDGRRDALLDLLSLVKSSPDRGTWVHRSSNRQETLREEKLLVYFLDSGVNFRTKNVEKKEFSGRVNCGERTSEPTILLWVVETEISKGRVCKGVP